MQLGFMNYEALNFIVINYELQQQEQQRRKVFIAICVHTLLLLLLITAV